MQRRLIVLILLMMLTTTALGPHMPSLETPPSYHDSNSVAPGADPILAADGDVSSQSITSFTETLDDDVPYYPDSPMRESNSYLKSGDYFDNSVPTHTADCSDTGWVVISSDFGAGTPTTDGDFVRITSTDNLGTLFIWQPEGGGEIPWKHFWCYIENYSNHIYFDAYYNGNWNIETSDPTPGEVFYYDLTSINYGSGVTAIGFFIPEYDNMTVDWWILTENDVPYYHDTGFAEDFADVSDWSFNSESTGLPGRSFTSDGDVLNFTIEYDDTGNEYATYTTSVSVSNVSYLEFRFRCSGTSGNTKSTRLTIRVNGVSFWSGIATDWTTKKYYLLNSISLPVTSVAISVDDYANTHDSGYGWALLDYIGIAPADSMGWQHDGSTTAGVEGSATSDGDLLTISSSANFTTDTTATVAAVSTSYYPFVEIYVSSGTGTAYVLDGNTWDTLGSLSAGANRFNVKAVASEYKKINVTGTNIVVDYVQGYSIANFTVTMSSYADTDDVVYVDGGVLTFSSNHYIILAHDPTLSVDTSVYNVWNITADTAEDCDFRPYVGGAWEYHDDDLRGTWDGTGTLTDFNLQFDAAVYTTWRVSAIKFWADHTAPSVVRSFATPPSPDDTTAVTLSAVITDSIGVYKTYFDAIVAPSSFSDTAYYATKQSDNLWTYTFDSLPTGYYCFKMVATDGANENALTEYAYISLTVSESEIRVDAITFFGASSDFNYMQLSGWINKKCSYTIREWSESYPVTETHTGTVNEGIFNIAWDKLGVTDTNANFTITFTNGTQTYTITGSYQTAYKQLQILNIVVNVPESSSTVDTNITVSFYTNKEVSYYVYQDDTLVTSGTVSEGLGTISWAKDTATGEHDYNIKWTDGVSIYWYNSSYYVYQHNIDNIEPKGSFSPTELRTSDIYWQNFLLLVILGGLVVLWFKDDAKNKRTGDLPNYGRRTRR
ncbi:MAG: hypothetical protein ACTSYX_04810 [Candidatus Thorarchaeota archaeon]